VRTRRDDRIAGRVRSDASVGDYGVLGARRPQRHRSTMRRLTSAHPLSRAVSQF